MLMKLICVFNMVWWFTLGMYMNIDQMLGGMGAFWLTNEQILDGGAPKGDLTAQLWFADVAMMLIAGGSLQARHRPHQTEDRAVWYAL